MTPEELAIMKKFKSAMGLEPELEKPEVTMAMAVGKLLLEKIELKKENDELRQDCWDIAHQKLDDLSTELKPLKKENAELRAALEEVAVCIDSGCCNRCYRLTGDHNNGRHCASCSACLKPGADRCGRPECKITRLLK